MLCPHDIRSAAFLSFFCGPSPLPFGGSTFFCGRRPLPFGGSHLRLPSGPAGIRTTTGSLSALARPTPYQLSHRVASCLSAGLRYLRLTRLPSHDRSPVPGGNRSAASCTCTVHNAAFLSVGAPIFIGIFLMEEAAVHRMATSITQMILSQKGWPVQRQSLCT